jgi:hypothetical protein
MSATLHAGVGRSTITPPVGIAHVGWGAQLHQRAEGIDQDFYATALVLREGDLTCALIELDLGFILVDEALAIRELVAEAIGTTPANVRLSYSHTHAGPQLQPTNLTEGLEFVPAYWETMRSQTVGAARAAAVATRPVRIGAAYGSSGIGVNRRRQSPDGRIVCSQNFDGFTDPTVTVARLDDYDGRPVAAIVGYACHPITLGFQNRLLSPDYPGIVRQTVEALTGATCLFLQGAAGDQMPIEGLTGDTSVHRRLGSRLGASAAEVFLGIDSADRRWVFDRVVESGAPLGLLRAELPEQTDTALRIATSTVRMPLRPTGDRGATMARRDAVAAELAALRESGAPDDAIRDGMFRVKRAEMDGWWASWYDGLAEVDLELHGMRIGPFATVGFPGEPFARIGVAVRERSPFRVTLMGGYTNGWAGYVPTADVYPDGGYEVEWGTNFTEGAEEALIDASVALLTRLA